MAILLQIETDTPVERHNLITYLLSRGLVNCSMSNQAVLMSFKRSPLGPSMDAYRYLNILKGNIFGFTWVRHHSRVSARDLIDNILAYNDC